MSRITKLTLSLACTLALLPAANAATGSAPAGATGSASVPAMGWHIVLRSGFDLICARMDAEGAKVRLFLHPGTDDFVDVNSVDIVTTEQVELPADAPSASPAASHAAANQTAHAAATVDLPSLTAAAGSDVNIDADLIASIIHAESAGNPHAVSRAGARGLMQLMPGTAGAVGVNDAFNPTQNVYGGAAYFSALLMYYQRDCRGSEQCELERALAAYNAGPGAVAKYHGIPPYRETRAYVARVIREFNRRKLRSQAQSAQNVMLARASAQ